MAQLQITPRKALLTVDHADPNQSLDPYIRFVVGGNEAFSSVHFKGGKFPKWETDSFLFTLVNEEIAKFEIWDSNEKMQDVLIGEGAVTVLEVVGSPGYVKVDNYPLTKNGQNVGWVTIQCNYTPPQNIVMVAPNQPANFYPGNQAHMHPPQAPQKPPPQAVMPPQQPLLQTAMPPQAANPPNMAMQQPGMPIFEVPTGAITGQAPHGPADPGGPQKVTQPPGPANPKAGPQKVQVERSPADLYGGPQKVQRPEAPAPAKTPKIKPLPARVRPGTPIEPPNKNMRQRRK